MNELRPKLFDVMKGYTKEQLIKDIISGIIVAIIALPLSIALAIASGVGPEQGLYTAIIAGFFISFFGGSRVQIGGPTAAFVVIIYGIVEQYGTDGDYGNLPFWLPDQIHSLYHYYWFHLWYRGNFICRTVERFLRS